ncbi:MAG: box helicase, partial [Mucilaginibacter sp.]|nr:box helicase [Mucilaginibacter sp.]
GYRGGERREGGGGERRSGGGERREGGYRGNANPNNAGFRDFSGKRREDRPERKRRF